MGEFKEIAKIELDFDQLEEWRRDDEEGLPVYSLISFYEACGMQAEMKKYYGDAAKEAASPVDVLSCNFYTLQRIKNFITEHWEIFSLVIEENNNVKWDTRKWAKNHKHYHRRLRSRVQNSLNFDFVNFCPAINDDLPDNVLSFAVYSPDGVAKEEAAT